MYTNGLEWSLVLSWYSLSALSNCSSKISLKTDTDTKTKQWFLIAHRLKFRLLSFLFFLVLTDLYIIIFIFFLLLKIINCLHLICHIIISLCSFLPHAGMTSSPPSSFSPCTLSPPNGIVVGAWALVSERPDFEPRTAASWVTWGNY